MNWFRKWKIKLTKVKQPQFYFQRIPRGKQKGKSKKENNTKED